MLPVSSGRDTDGRSWQNGIQHSSGSVWVSCNAFRSHQCSCCFSGHGERDFIDHFVFVYLDNILIFSKNQADHVKQVRLVLQWLLESRLFVKGEKQKFQVQTVSFLGFIVEQGRMRADPAKVRAMVEWPEPKTRKELQRFLGFANFYLRFIRDYCKVVISSVSLLLLKCCFTGLPLLNRPSTVSSSCSPPVTTRLC